MAGKTAKLQGMSNRYRAHLKTGTDQHTSGGGGTSNPSCSVDASTMKATIDDSLDLPSWDLVFGFYSGFHRQYQISLYWSSLSCICIDIEHTVSYRRCTNSCRTDIIASFSRQTPSFLLVA